MPDTQNIVYGNPLYFFNDQYYDDIVRRNIFELYNRTYQHSQLTQQILLDFDCHGGMLSDFKVDNSLNRKYGLPIGTHTFNLKHNIVPYFSEKRYIDIYDFKKPVSLYSLCKDKGTFSHRIKFTISDYVFMSLRVISLEDKTTLLCIYPDSNEGIAADDYDKLLSEDAKWAIEFENPSDIYFSYLEKSQMFPNAGNRIPLSVFPKLNNIIFNKRDMENEWTILISASKTSPNLLTQSMCKMVVDKGVRYFEISERFKKYINGLASNCKVYITNDYDLLGKYIYSGHGPLSVLLDFKDNPVLPNNIVVNEYDASNDRLVERLKAIINTYYPNVYDFSSNSGFIHNSVIIEPDTINYSTEVSSGLTGYGITDSGNQFVCGKKGYLAKSKLNSVMWSKIEITNATIDQSTIDFTDIVVAPNNRLLVVGGNYAFISLDGGTTWSQTEFDREVIKAIWAVDRFYLVGRNGLFAYTDTVATKTTTWITTDILDVKDTFNDIFYRTNEFVIVGDNGTVLVSSGNANSWIKKTLNIPDDVTERTINTVAWDGKKYLAAGLNGLLIEAVNGNNWKYVKTNLTDDIYKIIFFKNNYYAVGKNVIVTSISGSAWYYYLEPSAFDNMKAVIYTDIIPVNDNFILVGRTEDGSDWDYENSSPLTHLKYASFTLSKDTVIDINGTITGFIKFDNTIFAGCTDGKIYKFDPNTDTWSPVAGTAIPIDYAYKINDTSGIMVGHNGVVYRTLDSGVTWETYQIPINKNFYCVKYFATSNICVAVGANGAIATSTDMGKTWRVETSAEKDYDFLSVEFNGTIYVATTSDGSVVSTTNVHSWTTKLNIGTTAMVNSVAVYNGQFIAVTSAGEMLRSPNGTAWTRTLLSNDYNYDILWVDKSEDTYIITTADGVLFVSDNTIVWDKINVNEDIAILSAVKYSNGYKYGVNNSINTIAYGKLTFIQNYFDSGKNSKVTSIRNNKNQLLFGIDGSSRLFAKACPYFYISTADRDWIYTSISKNDMKCPNPEKLIDMIEFFGKVYAATMNGYIFNAPADTVETANWSMEYLDSFIVTKFVKTTNTLFCIGLLNGEPAIAYKTNGSTWTIIDNIGDTDKTKFEHIPVAIIYSTERYLVLCTDGKFYSTNNLIEFTLTENMLPEMESGQYNDMLLNSGIIIACGANGSIFVSENDGSSWNKAELETTANYIKIYWSNGLYMVLAESAELATSTNDRDWYKYTFTTHSPTYESAGLYVDYNWNVFILGGAFDRYNIVFEGGKNLYISYYEAKNTGNVFDNNFKDFIDYIGNGFIQLVIDGHLPEPFNGYKPIMDFVFDYSDYLAHPTYGDVRAYMIHKVMELLHDNPDRYNKLYREIDIRNYDHIHSSFIIKDYPEILERSVMDTKEFELIEDDIVWFNKPHTYIEITNSLGYNKPVAMWINGLRYLYTATTTVKNIQRVFIPLDVIDENSVIVIDSPMYASSFAYSKHTGQFTLTETGVTTPFPNSKAFGKIKGTDLLYYDATTMEYLDPSKLNISANIPTEDIEHITKGGEADIQYGVSEENFLLSSEPLFYITSDEEKIRLQKERTNVKAPNHDFSKPIDTEIIEIDTGDYEMTNRTIGVTNTDTYRMGRIPDFSKKKVFEFLNFREKPDLNKFYIYANGKLLTPDQMEKVKVTMPEKYGDALSFDFSGLNLFPEEAEIIIEYYPTTDVKIYDDTVYMENFVLTILEDKKLPRAYKIEELRIFVDGKRLAKHQIVQVPGCNLFFIKDMVGTHHLTIIAYKTDPDPYQFSDESNKLNNIMASSSEEYAKFLYLKYNNDRT